MIVGFTESVVEEAARGWLEALDYQVLHWPNIEAYPHDTPYPS
ncbi:MAG: hypothetical protein OJF50_001908 [Nitrospira sp.]|jgi:hypothetical protein|nr:hypothetical protein [Nitrospira sp.]